jgi:multidrug resistance efflux pump
MRVASCLVVATYVIAVTGCGPAGLSPGVGVAQAAERAGDTELGEVSGKTQPAPGRKGVIAPVVLHPVEQVLVTTGDRVKKDQKLVEIDADEPKADLRGKEAALRELEASLERLLAEPRKEEQDEARAGLENSQVATKSAREIFDRIEPLWQKGSIPEIRYHEAKVSLAKLQAEERAAAARLERLLKRPFAKEVAEMKARIAAAQAGVDSAKAELEHYTVTAPIEGVVTVLEVSPGTVSRPGTSVWGEILDLRELDVRCEVSPRQADALVVGQSAEVFQDWRREERFPGQVTFVSPAADPRTGRVPVLVRVKNPKERLRCYVDVKVQFGNGAKSSGQGR